MFVDGCMSHSLILLQGGTAFRLSLPCPAEGRLQLQERRPRTLGQPKLPKHRLAPRKPSRKAEAEDEQLELF